MKRLGVLWVLLLVIVMGVYAQTNYAIYSTDKDEMTGDVFQYYVLFAERGGGTGGVIGIKHNIKEEDVFTIRVAGAGYLVADDVKVWFKFDDGKILKTTLPVVDARNAFYIVGDIGLKFIESALWGDSKKLIMRVFVPYDSPVTFVFDLTSLQRTVEKHPIINK